MLDLLLGVAAAIVIALWWVVTVGATLAGQRPPHPGKGRGPKWGSFGPL